MKKLYVILTLILFSLATTDAYAASWKLGKDRVGGSSKGTIGGGTIVVTKCNADADCGSGSYCNTSTHQCRPYTGACSRDNQCASGYYCSKSQCKELSMKCNTNNFTITGDHTVDCYDCMNDSQCGGTKNKCETTSRTCVECISNADCEGTPGLTDPYCDLASNTCKSTTCEAAHCNTCATGESNVCASNACEDGYVEVNGVCEKCSDKTSIAGGTCTGACTRIGTAVTCYPDGVTCSNPNYVLNSAGNACVQPTCSSNEVFTESLGCVDLCDESFLTYNGTETGGTWASNGTECVYTPASNTYDWVAMSGELLELGGMRDLGEPITGGTTGTSTGSSTGSGGGGGGCVESYIDEPTTTINELGERQVTYQRLKVCN